jgi:hypothetical protein
MTSTDEAGRDTRGDQETIAERVRVDVPRVLPEDMVTTQVVEPPRDPDGGRGADMEFMTRNAGW